MVFRSRIAAGLTALICLAFAGCNGHLSSDGSDLASDVPMNSSRTAKQLLTGFYNVESGAWRWTAKNFSVALGVPPGAAAKGGKVEFRLVFPDSAVKALHSITLAAKVHGTTLEPETFSTPGEHNYTRDIPASELATSPVRIDFTLDKAMPPGPVDVRELGVIANEISLTAK